MTNLPTTEEEAYVPALAMLKTLEEQLHRLRDDQRMWNRVQKIIAANPDLHKPSDFYRWMRDMYVSGIAMAIRRLVDDDPDSISFINFLKLIKQFPGVVSRDRYRKLFHGEGIAHRNHSEEMDGVDTY